MLEVEPDVEGRLGGHGDLEAKALETLEDVVALGLEVPLQGDLLLVSVLRIEERKSSELQASQAQIVREVAQSSAKGVHTGDWHHRRGKNQTATVPL